MEKEELEEALEMLVHDEKEKELRLDAELKHRRGITLFYLFVHLFIFLFIYLFIYSFIHLFIYLFI
jgi:hypothetical protein